MQGRWQEVDGGVGADLASDGGCSGGSSRGGGSVDSAAGGRDGGGGGWGPGQRDEAEGRDETPTSSPVVGR
jgi:hypothetical protein